MNEGREEEARELSSLPPFLRSPPPPPPAPFHQSTFSFSGFTVRSMGHIQRPPRPLPPPSLQPLPFLLLASSPPNIPWSDVFKVRFLSWQFGCRHRGRRARVCRFATARGALVAMHERLGQCCGGGLPVLGNLNATEVVITAALHRNDMYTT